MKTKMTTTIALLAALTLSACAGEQRVYPPGGSDTPATREWRGIDVEAPFDFTQRYL